MRKGNWCGCGASLVNIPHEVRIGARGEFATLDTYARLGHEHAVVVYDKRGRVLADYALEDLLTPEEVRRVPRTMSSRHWLTGNGADNPDAAARFTYHARVPHLVIRPAATRGHALRINLETGKLKP